VRLQARVVGFPLLFIAIICIGTGDFGQIELGLTLVFCLVGRPRGSGDGGCSSARYARSGPRPRRGEALNQSPLPPMGR
jgi:hypothetical protein